MKRSYEMELYIIHRSLYNWDAIRFGQLSKKFITYCKSRWKLRQGSLCPIHFRLQISIVWNWKQTNIYLNTLMKYVHKILLNKNTISQNYKNKYIYTCFMQWCRSSELFFIQWWYNVIKQHLRYPYVEDKGKSGDKFGNWDKWKKKTKDNL